MFIFAAVTPLVSSLSVEVSQAQIVSTVGVSTPTPGQSPTLTFRYELTNAIVNANLFAATKPTGYSDFTPSTDVTKVQALKINNQAVDVATRIASLSITTSDITVVANGSISSGSIVEITFATGVVVNPAAGEYAWSWQTQYTGQGVGSFSANLSLESTPPTLVSTSPVSGAVDVAVTTSIVLNLSETVVPGSGNFLLSLMGGDVIETISVSDTARVNFNASTVTITLSLPLQPSSSYSLSVGSGAIVDGASNVFVGLGSNAPLTFTTAAAQGTSTTTTTFTGTVFQPTKSALDGDPRRSSDEDLAELVLVKLTPDGGGSTIGGDIRLRPKPGGPAMQLIGVSTQPVSLGTSSSRVQKNAMVVANPDINVTVNYSGADYNKPEVWKSEGFGDDCWKIDFTIDGVYIYALPTPTDSSGRNLTGWTYSTIIVKAGSVTDPSLQVNTIFRNVPAGYGVFADVNANGISDPGGRGKDKAISHVVFCGRAPQQSVNSPTTTTLQSTSTLASTTSTSSPTTTTSTTTTVSSTIVNSTTTTPQVSTTQRAFSSTTSTPPTTTVPEIKFEIQKEPEPLDSNTTTTTNAPTTTQALTSTSSTSSSSTTSTTSPPSSLDSSTTTTVKDGEWNPRGATTTPPSRGTVRKRSVCGAQSAFKPEIVDVQLLVSRGTSQEVVSMELCLNDFSVISSDIPSSSFVDEFPETGSDLTLGWIGMLLVGIGVMIQLSRRRLLNL